MKKQLCFLLMAVTLVLVIARYACAEKDQMLVVYDVGTNTLQEWSKALGLNKEIEVSWYDWREPLLLRLTGSNPPDFFVVRTHNDDYERIRDLRLLADLSGNDAIREDIMTMPSVFRSLLIEESGAIYGVPESVTPDNELYWIPTAWEEFGFSPGMIPDSFESLLDCLEFYLNTSHEGYCVFYYTADPDALYTYRRWLINWLVCTWNAQRIYSGDDIGESRLVDLISRAIRIGERLDQSEPQSEQEKRELIPLFHGGIRGRGLTNDGAYSYTMDQIVPERLFSDQPALITISMNLVCCRANSSWTEDAPALLELCIHHRPDWAPFYCHPDQGNVDIYNSQIESDYLNVRFTSAWLESLIASALIPVAPISITSNDEYRQITMQLLRREITPGQYVRELMAGV